MKCRNCIKNSSGMYDVVWFNKINNIEGSEKYDNYLSNSQGVTVSLIQRLAVIKSELWYQINYGLPLFDKVRNKTIIDSTIINIILSHPEVTGIAKYSSYTDEKTRGYFFECDINTIYNEKITINSNLLYV